AVVKFFGCVVTVVSPGDPRPAHFNLADCFPVPRKHGVAIRESHLDARFDATSLRPPIHQLFFAATFWRIRSGGERARLSHSPRLNNLYTEALLESFHQASWHGRPSADHHPQR